MKEAEIAELGVIAGSFQAVLILLDHLNPAMLEDYLTEEERESIKLIGEFFETIITRIEDKVNLHLKDNP